MSDIWGYGPATGYTAGATLIGYKVEATDGSIGKVDKHSDEVGASYLVVDTGVWIFGKHVLLPAGTVSRIDDEGKTIYVERTKAEIKDAPEFDRDKHLGDAGYHEQVAIYYGRQHRA
ncbi:PRC-barrel domain-containing protein [Streptomyces platensis]|uniref:PRC-barrel domain-containing protein n=1 Tax=Streptomyces platensis TaxID=58346 RepID=UPI003C2CB9C2